MNSRWLRHAALAALLGASSISYVCTPTEAAEPTVPVRVVTQVKGGILEISVTWANEASPIFKSEYSSGAARITIDGASLKGDTQVVPLEGNNAKEALVSQVDDETVVVNIRAANEPNIKVFQIPTVKNVKGVKYVLPINLLSASKPAAAAPKADDKKPTAATKAEASKPAAAPKAEAKKSAVAPKADDKKPAAAPKAEAKKSAVAPKADDKKPAAAAKADDKKPAAATKAEASKPAAAAKADDKKPAAAPKADDKKPAVAPKAEASKPAVAPKADDKKPAAATKAEASKPAAAPKADDKKPAAAPKAEASKPAAAPKADDKKPAAAPKAEASKPAAAPKADDKKTVAKPKAENVRKVDTKPAPPQLTAKDDPVKVKVIFNPKADELRIGLIYKGNLKNVVKRASGSDSAMSIELCPATLQGPTQSAKLERGQIISYQAKQAAANKVIIEVKVQNPPYFVQDVDVHGGAFYGISYNYAQDYKPATKPAATPKADAKPAAAPKADAKPTAAPKADATKPAATPKADAKPAAAPKADATKPAAAPKADATKPAATPKADATKPAAAPKADATKPAAAPKADATKPAAAPKADATKPATATTATPIPAAETSVVKENAAIVKDHYAYFPLKERSAAAVADSLVKLYPNVDFKVDEMLNVIFVQGSAEDVAKIGNVLKVVSNFEK